jgi:hypothetical protein
MHSTILQDYLLAISPDAALQPPGVLNLPLDEEGATR